MSVLSGYSKYKRYILTSSGYKLCSHWTSSNTVHFDDGKTAQTKVGAINGITDSLTSTSSNVALSSKAGKSLQDQVTQLNTGIAFDSGITVSNRFVKIRFTCRVKGNRVLMQGIFYGNSTAVEGQNHAIANISGNIKPSTQIDTIACIQDGNYHYLGSACLTVTANNIQVSSNISMAGRYVQFSVSYDL